MQLSAASCALAPARRKADAGVRENVGASKKLASNRASQGDDLDAIIMSHAQARWRKVALIAALTMSSRGVAPTDANFDIVVVRLRDLVARGRLEAQGDLFQPRFSEARLPDGERSKDRH